MNRKITGLATAAVLTLTLASCSSDAAQEPTSEPVPAVTATQEPSTPEPVKEAEVEEAAPAPLSFEEEWEAMEIQLLDADSDPWGAKKSSQGAQFAKDAVLALLDGEDSLSSLTTKNFAQVPSDTFFPGDRDAKALEAIEGKKVLDTVESVTFSAPYVANGGYPHSLFNRHKDGDMHLIASFGYEATYHGTKQGKAAEHTLTQEVTVILAPSGKSWLIDGAYAQINPEPLVLP